MRRLALILAALVFLLAGCGKDYGNGGGGGGKNGTTNSGKGY